MLRRLEQPPQQYERLYKVLIILSRHLTCDCGQGAPLKQFNFRVQVKHAEEAGAAGAIVYDDVYEALIIMSKPRDHVEPGIPSVFVAQKTGIVMKRLMSPGSTIVRIAPVSFLSMRSGPQYPVESLGRGFSFAIVVGFTITDTVVCKTHWMELFKRLSRLPLEVEW